MSRSQRDITKFAHGGQARGYQSTFGLRTATATRKRGSWKATKSGGLNGHLEPTAPRFSRSILFSSSTAQCGFQRMNTNGY